VRRKLWFALGALAVACLALAWVVFFPASAVSALDATKVRSVDIQFLPWGEDDATPPGASSTDPEAIAALVTVLRRGTETTDHKCGSRGSIILRRSFGGPMELRFLPGHDTEWYEFRYDRKAYRVPRAGFIAAMRRVGVEVPLQCQ
jgi:hypothetical protein